jgi:hypothetical protein
MYTCLHTYVYALAYTNVSICIQTCIHADIHAYMHTYISDNAAASVDCARLVRVTFRDLGNWGECEAPELSQTKLLGISVFQKNRPPTVAIGQYTFDGGTCMNVHINVCNQVLQTDTKLCVCVCVCVCVYMCVMPSSILVSFRAKPWSLGTSRMMRVYMCICLVHTQLFETNVFCYVLEGEGIYVDAA